MHPLPSGMTDRSRRRPFPPDPQATVIPSPPALTAVPGFTGSPSPVTADDTTFSSLPRAEVLASGDGDRPLMRSCSF